MQLSDAQIVMAMAGSFVLLWLSVSMLSAKLGAWSKLSNSYAAYGLPTGKMFRFRSARLGKVNYNNALNVQVSSRGLYLVPIILFRFGHPPILIPWRDIRLKEKKAIFGTNTVLRIGKPEIVTLRFAGGFMERSGIRQYSNRYDATDE